MSFLSPAATTGCYCVLYTFRTVPVAERTSSYRTQDSPAHIGKVYLLYVLHTAVIATGQASDMQMAEEYVPTYQPRGEEA